MSHLLKLGSDTILDHVTYLFKLISEPIYPSLFPIPLIPFIHAARLSWAYQHLRVKAGGHLSWTADLTGYLVMAWGGSVMVSLVLYQPIAQLVSPRPLIIYTLTHWILKLVRFRPSLATLDRLLPLPDALIRTATITAAVDAVVAHREAAYAGSLMLQLFIGAMAASGGSALAQAVGATQPAWRWARPEWMERPSALRALDVWSGVLIAIIYGILRQTHPVYRPLAEALMGPSQALLAPAPARGACAILLSFIYFWRAHETHKIPPKPITQVTKVDKSE
ncbi:hypothetical protein CROQUDRAFT_38661 [Cronartium quercuum f. sp. fusiforme G11]|uniref:Uncharacterized protein n=1 Tax=Cronartium quercuum f. sp. fusiforme G11 TaxID=708437 RepID=A0A9P6NTW2_9BASI|nr:hypothetical protein CROQUDRAFT_38661 [Cronartium quercuum f. sp. fusiforme G11]